MATREQFKTSKDSNVRRTFSDEFKKKKVREVEQKISTVLEISKEYGVSTVNIYRWIKKFSVNYTKQERLILETESDTKKLLALQKRIAELERTIGQKQVIIDFQGKMIELAEEYYQVDIKKKFESKPSSGSGKTENS